MSRRIAFRAWDKRRQKYIYRIPKYGARKWFVLERGILRFAWGDNFILEQDTGLKDKDGKRIYEGSIVRYDAIDYVYFWDDELAGFDIKRLDGKNWFGYASFEQVREGRIVGNIHEGIDEKEEV